MLSTCVISSDSSVPPSLSLSMPISHSVYLEAATAFTVSHEYAQRSDCFLHLLHSITQFMLICKHLTCRSLSFLLLRSIQALRSGTKHVCSLVLFPRKPFGHFKKMYVDIGCNKLHAQIVFTQAMHAKKLNLHETYRHGGCFSSLVVTTVKL